MGTIQNGSNIALNALQGTLPNMMGALLDYFQNTTFTLLTKTVVNFQLSVVQTDIVFFGTVQPLSPQQLNMKPEGQRQWVWKQVHALPPLALAPDEAILYLGVRYRVMAKLDYTEYGYVEYHLVQDYTGGMGA